MFRSSNPKKSKDWIAREHQNNFGSWLRLQIMDQDVGVQLVDMNPDDIEILQILASGPSTTHHMILTVIHFIQGHKTTRKQTKIGVFELMPTTMIATRKPIMGS
jgi:hypothetical protein